MKKNVFIVFLVSYFISCSPSQKALDAEEDKRFNKWIGHSKMDLVKVLGQPDSIRTDGKGGEILIYKERVDAKAVMNEKYTGKQFSFRKEMYVNADSTIYYWKAWRRK